VSWYTIITGFVCGFFLLSGFLSLVLTVRNIERLLNCAFFGFSLLITGALIFEALGLFSVTLEDMLLYDRLVTAFIVLSGVPFIILIAELTEYRPRAVMWSLSSLLGVLMVLNWVLPNGLTWSEIRGIKPLQLAWGEQVLWFDADTGVFHLVAIAVMIAVFIFALRAVMHQRRHGDAALARQHILMISLGLLGVFSELVLLEITGVITGFIDVIGFVAFVFIIGHRNFYKLLRSVDLIRESDERFALLTDVAFEGIGLSRKGTILDVNQQLADMLGYTRQEMIGQPALEFVAPQSREQVEEYQHAEKELPYEHLAIRKDGSIFPVEVRVRSISHKQQPIRVTIIRDISEHKETEEQNILLAQTLKSVQDCISITDSEDRIIFVNDAFQTVYGYREEDIIGKPVSILRPDGLSSEQTQGIFPSTREGGWHGEIVNRRKDGSVFSVELWTSVVRDRNGNPMAYVGVARDISDRRLAESSLIAEKERAERSEKLKDAFIANISHEVRTPLNIILGYTGLIQELLNEKADAEEIGYFDSVRRGAHRLQRTVDMILSISRLQVGDFTISPAKIDLSTMLHEIVEDYHPTAEEQGLDISFIDEAPGSTVVADEYCTTQSVQNLLDNAVKYTEHGGVTVTLRRTQDGSILIEVKDTGIGISAEYLPRVFDPYTQEESGYSRSFEGIGLGLSLVKKYTELIGATLQIQSKKALGTTVTMSFPLREDADAEDGAAGPSTGHTAAAEKEAVLPTLLVVEDDMLTVQYMRTLLRKDFQMFSAVSGKEAWEVIEKEHIDLVLMDLSLSGDTSGLELTRQFRSDSRFASLPIVAITAHAMTYDRDRCLEAGCDAFLLKPAVREDLMEIIGNLLDRKS